MTTAIATILEPTANNDFIETPYVKGILKRAMNYLKAGFPIHFSGVSGTGKTALGLRVAELLGNPVVLIHGDEQMTTTGLVGGEVGYHLKRMRDNFIHSVVKEEEDASKRWIDHRLTAAVENGYTFFYDEFTRSRPEANNVLLSVLQEQILDLPSQRDNGDTYIKVHPGFHAIFTSNPKEYAGVHHLQDALKDRMVTINLEPLDMETELSITIRKSGISVEEAEMIVKMVRHLRGSGKYACAPTVRACIMIGRAVQASDLRPAVHFDDKTFTQICYDILTSETSRQGENGKHNGEIRSLVEKSLPLFCTSNLRRGEGFKIIQGDRK